MIVRFWMTSNRLVTAEEETDLFEILRLMRTNGVRRIPILRAGKLCGIIALSDLYRFAAPSVLGGKLSAIPAIIEEELRKYKAREIMSTNLYTCGPNAPLEEIGILMRGRKIGALPVISEGKLVGIITESDVLEALAKIAWAGQDTSRLCLRIPHKRKEDIFREIMELCGKYKIELSTLLTHSSQDSKSDIVMLKVKGSRRQDFVKALWDYDYQVVASR